MSAWAMTCPSTNCTPLYLPISLIHLVDWNGVEHWYSTVHPIAMGSNADLQGMAETKEQNATTDKRTLRLTNNERGTSNIGVLLKVAWQNGKFYRQNSMAFAW